MRHLPYVVTFLIPLQSVLTALGLRYAVYALLAGGTAAFLGRAALRGRAAAAFRPVWLFVGYVAVLALTQWSLVSLYGFLVYSQFALFWLAYAYAYRDIDVERLTRVNLAIASLVAVIGIYQYFFNPALWGFGSYGYVEVFVAAGAALRINSLLPSAMMLGAYMVVSALLALTLPARGRWVKVAVLLCLLCAFLTGSKSTLFSLGAVVVYALSDRGARRHGYWGTAVYLSGAAVVYVALLSVVDVWGPWLERFNPTVFRVIAPFFLMGDTRGVSLLLGYWATLFTFYGGAGLAVVAFGNGVGLTRQETTFFGGRPLGDFPVAESFLVQLVFELGAIGFALFHVVLWRVFRRARARRAPNRVGFDHMLVALYGNLIVVHVFSGVVLGFLWGYFVALLSNERPNEVTAKISAEEAESPTF